MLHNPILGEQGEGVSVHAGFPNPAIDRRQKPLSLDQLLIRHPVSTYFFRIEGNQWEQRGIFGGDIAIIDRALEARERDLVIWWSDSGELYLTNFQRARQQNIWGVVTSIIHNFRETALKNEGYGKELS